MLNFCTLTTVGKSFRSVLSRTSFVRSFSGQAVTASMVKKLREQSGAPMMDCKKALGANDANMDKAMDWLRAKGISKGKEKADRVTSEGLIAVLSNTHKNTMTLVEVNSETDFVAKNKDFLSFVGLTAQRADEASHDGSLTPASKYGEINIAPEVFMLMNDNRMQDSLGEVVSTIRENIVVKRITTLGLESCANTTLLACYVHGKAGSMDSITMGKAAAVVELSVSAGASKEALRALEKAGRKIAMHVVAAKPIYTNESEVSPEFLEREQKIMQDQMDAENAAAAKPKPADIQKKIMEGKMKKRLADVCLSSQNHVAEEGNPPVGKFLDHFGKSHGVKNVELKGFRMWELSK